MTWELRVGQKVVCVDNSPHPWAGECHLQEGAIYTIAGLPKWDGETGVALVEQAPHYPLIGFKMRRFRPLVTDTQKWLREVLETPPPLTTKRHEVERLP
jgi:hypothetical protein